jgi:ketosteroid isomerase-like protein
MKKIVFILIFIVCVFSFATESKSQTSDKAGIEKLIFAYQDALNASDAAKVISLYTENGVLMANAAPTSEGAAQLKGTYEYIFQGHKGHKNYLMAYS